MRPLAPPLSVGGLLLELASILMIAAAFVALIIAWARLPDTAAVHFNLLGIPGWGSRAILWTYPAAAAFVHMGLSVVARLAQRFNYPADIDVRKAQRQYALALAMFRWIKAEISAVALMETVQAIRVSLGTIENIAFWPHVTPLAIFATTGALYLVKILRAK